MSEALQVLRAHQLRPDSKMVGLRESRGCVLTEDIVSPVSLPHFDNSAMDGYAVGGPSGPWEIQAQVPAGDPRKIRLGPCDAARVFTGSRVPESTFGVIAQEDVTLYEHVLMGDVVESKHMRLTGEDLQQGDLVLKAGTLLTPPRIAALAALGLSEIVVQSMNCGVITTGNEVIEPGTDRNAGDVYNSNKFAVQSILDFWGLESSHVHVKDDLDELTVRMGELSSQHHLLISTGGVSVGDHDHLIAAAVANGFRIEFHKVAVKPGKPIAFGTREDGRIWIGLPGNPLSALVGMLVFTAALVGRELDRRHFVLEETMIRPRDREEFIPAIIGTNGAMLLRNVIGSHSNVALTDSTVLAHIPLGSKELEKGTIVEGLILPWGVA